MTVLALDYLSPTAIGRLLTCEERFRFAYVDKEREPGTEQTATGIGFAEALEKGWDRGLRAYNGARPPVDELWDDADLRENERLLAESVIKHAAITYSERYSVAKDAATNVRREVEYIVQATPGKRGEPTPILYVRADGAGSQYMVEDKLRSGSSLGADTIAQECARGHQLTAEVYVHWRKTGDLLPVMFRLIRKPDRRKTKAFGLDGEAMDAFVGEWFQTSDKAYDEREVTRTLDDMHRFEAELRRLWTQRADLLAGKTPVRNPSACFSYGRVCPFADRCGQ